MAHDLRNTFSNFTPLRLLLAVMVVLGHFQMIAGVTSPPWPFSYAAVSVDCFFVVSGYLISSSIDRDPNLIRFYIRRLFRIYPLYIVVIAAQAAILLVLTPPAAPVSAVMVLRYIIANATFANFLQPDLGNGILANLPVKTLNPSMWTLKIEIGFYLIMPLIWMATRRLGWSLLVVLFVSSAAYQLMMKHAGYPELARQLPGQLQFFVLGIALYRLQGRPALSPRFACAAALGVGCAITAMHHTTLPVIYPLLIAALVALVALKAPTLSMETDMSYGVYLIHGPIIQLSLLLGLYRQDLIGLVVTLAVVFALAWSAERIIEAPGIDLGRRLIRHVSQRQSSTSAS
jgi:peptidoglycan/LPS O-acetylase OafA/YrhL